MLVILFITYFGFNMAALPAAILSFTIAPAAFIAEYYRSAFLGVDEGQFEAARSLGLPYHNIILNVILPQAFRIALPSLGNVMLDLFKGTSLAAMITVSEIFMEAKVVAGGRPGLHVDLHRRRRDLLAGLLPPLLWSELLRGALSHLVEGKSWLVNYVQTDTVDQIVID